MKRTILTALFALNALFCVNQMKAITQKTKKGIYTAVAAGSTSALVFRTLQVLKNNIIPVIRAPMLDQFIDINVSIREINRVISLVTLAAGGALTLLGCIITRDLYNKYLAENN